MTPLEFTREMDAAQERDTELQTRNIAQAWQVAAFAWELQATGNLRPLADVLDRLKPTQTPVEAQKKASDALLGQLTFLSKKLGTPLRPLSPEAEAAFVRVNGR